MHAAGEATFQLVALVGHQGGGETLIRRRSSQGQLEERNTTVTHPAQMNLFFFKERHVRNQRCERGGTYGEHASHDPSVVLSQGLSISGVWVKEKAAFEKMLLNISTANRLRVFVCFGD